MRLFVLASLLAAVLSGCALRPRYADFITATTAGKEATFVVTDANTSQPVPGAKVDVSEGKNRIIVTTGPDGTFKLPVDKKYVDENSIMVVTLPKGFEVYRVSLAAPSAPAPLAPAVTPSPVEPTIETPPQAQDAGVPVSNG